MEYCSTRNQTLCINSAEAISKGISGEGGLFVPEAMPTFSLEQLESLVSKNYAERAYEVLSAFLTDFTKEELLDCVRKAYSDEKFDSNSIAEIAKVGNHAYFLELWHGPTCAFKDMALQLLPHLLTVSAKKVIPGKEIVILVATSGDTGKAALEGFKDVEGTKILVFYPVNGVSQMQKLQMTTQEGKNVAVCAIDGNFDDAQNGVKRIFTDTDIANRLSKQNQIFSSANSINWGRLVPQIVYYISAYVSLYEQKEITLGEPVNIVVPTGNFGNILAAYYAKLMGLPVGKLICASNRNCVLTDFLRTGIYDANRDFHCTSSPSMDILISSNLERLLFELCGRNDEPIKAWFEQLKATGRYQVTPTVLSKLQDEFFGGSCTDEETIATIGETFREYGYLMDTHTAVAAKVYKDYQASSGDCTKTIIASTASPYKFTDNVLKALTPWDSIPEDGFAQLKLLEEISGMVLPAALRDLQAKSVRFADCVEKDQMTLQILNMLD